MEHTQCTALVRLQGDVGSEGSLLLLVKLLLLAIVSGLTQLANHLVEREDLEFLLADALLHFRQKHVGLIERRCRIVRVRRVVSCAGTRSDSTGSSLCIGTQLGLALTNLELVRFDGLARLSVS